MTLLVITSYKDSIVAILHIQNSIILIQTTEYNALSENRYNPNNVSTPNILLIPYIYSVSPRINIKGGGVHQWYMAFGQQCSIGVIK